MARHWSIARSPVIPHFQRVKSDTEEKIVKHTRRPSSANLSDTDLAGSLVNQREGMYRRLPSRCRRDSKLRPEELPPITKPQNHLSPHACARTVGKRMQARRRSSVMEVLTNPKSTLFVFGRGACAFPSLSNKWRSLEPPLQRFLGC